MKEIDAKLGIDEKTEAEIAAKQPKRTIDEINDELLKLYQNQPENAEIPQPDQKETEQAPLPPAIDQKQTKMPSPKKESKAPQPALRPKGPKLTKR